MNRKRLLFAIILSLALSTNQLIASAATPPLTLTPSQHAALPLVGAPCTTVGQTKASAFYKYTCNSGTSASTWGVKALSYSPPPNYVKGYAIGQALQKSNPQVKANTDMCFWTSQGALLKGNSHIAGKAPATTISILGDYWGFMGCLDGYLNPSTSVAKAITLPDPVNSGVLQLQNSEEINASQAISDMFSGIVDSFQNQDIPTALSFFESFEYPDLYDANATASCDQDRVSSNWTITEINYIPQSLSYDPAFLSGAGSANAWQDRTSGVTSFPEVPVRFLVQIESHDDINGDVANSTWAHVVFDDTQATPQFFLSTCPMLDEAANADTTIDIPPVQASGGSGSGSNNPPTGKVDKTSNAYKTMFTVGRNFAKISTASDTAQSQCNSARTTGLIMAEGHPQYLGMQAQMIQSYLNTASGYQGCLDGFGH